MIKSLTDIEDGTHIDTDVCIIGGGVAGQTLAISLAGSGLDVTVLESGDKDFRSDIQNMMFGENIGHEYYELINSRLRLFGGTAAIWGGRCAELDEIDFEKRKWVKHSGWPIKKTDLDPYYAEVFRSLGLPRPGEGGDLWDETGRMRPEFDPKKLEAGLWVFDENGERFTDTRRAGLESANIILNATVTAINLKDSGAVESVNVQSLNKVSATVRAKTFVLAAGGIETIRLLMAAVPNRPEGFGNEHDQLGRFFMEHPHGRGGEIIPTKLVQTLAAMPRSIRVDGTRYVAYIRPSPELQEKHGILNTSISLSSSRRVGEAMELHRKIVSTATYNLPSKKVFRRIFRILKYAAIRSLEITEPYSTAVNLKRSRGKMGLFASIRAEQAPNPDSRIILTNDTDALGLRRVALDWQFSDIDRESVRVLMQALGEEYERLGWGHVVPSDWLSNPDIDWETDSLISDHSIGGYHHMGGTRMSANAKTGVVDKNCRLHASPNLYVASSSVFTTSGWANPTATIMALSLRLGDHLRQKHAKAS